MITYTDMMAAHQTEFNAFPIMFAFSDEQFAKGMRMLGLDPSDTDIIYAWSEVNGFYRKSDAPKLHEMLKRQEREIAEAIASDGTGEGFIMQMFSYELANHEYSYTGDVVDTLDALGLALEAVNADERLSHGLKLAIEAQRDPLL